MRCEVGKLTSPLVSKGSQSPFPLGNNPIVEHLYRPSANLGLVNLDALDHSANSHSSLTCHICRHGWYQGQIRRLTELCIFCRDDAGRTQGFESFKL